MENEKVHIFITKEELSDEQLKGAKGLKLTIKKKVNRDLYVRYLSRVLYKFVEEY